MSGSHSSTGWFDFFKKNVIHEVPFGHTLTKGIRQIPHDLKHAGGMVAGTVVMMAGPMPMPEDMDSETAEDMLKFSYMLAYMYLGDIAFKISYNLIAAGLNALGDCICPSVEEDEDISEPLLQP